ncbi:MAG: hypothetical protein LBV18_04145 [Alistipes sp.]|jgi:hypothetical protein|nr:hypothetical protein [Alistipes sp.]
MSPAILGIFIPILFVIGLFTAISLNIYYKYKARVAHADHPPGASIAEWYEAEARAKASVSRTAALRLGAFLTGAGAGTILGMFVGRAPAVWEFFGSFAHYDEDLVLAFQFSVWALFILACAILVGGLFMLIAYFAERIIDRKKSNN